MRVDMLAPDPKKRTTAMLLLATVLLWQVWVFIHLIAVEHIILEDGTIVQRRHHDEETDTSDGQHDKHGPHKGCPLLTSLTSPNAVTSQICLFISLFEMSDTYQSPCFHANQSSQRERYRLSPAQSPPSTCPV